jgi:hypothetical protein
MVRVLSYLSFKELLIISGVNRRLYIVSGDIDLLKMHSKQRDADIGAERNAQPDGFFESPVKVNTMQHINAGELREYVYSY